MWLQITSSDDLVFSMPERQSLMRWQLPLVLWFCSCTMEPSPEDLHQEGLKFAMIWANLAFSGTSETIDKLIQANAARDEWKSCECLHTETLIEDKNQLLAALGTTRLATKTNRYSRHQALAAFAHTKRAALYHFNGGMHVLVFFDHTWRMTSAISTVGL